MNKYVRDICKPGQGAACCRYLLYGEGGWECGKVQTELIDSLQDRIDNTGRKMPVKDLIDDNVAKGLMVSVGDNCEGKESSVLNSE